MGDTELCGAQWTLILVTAECSARYYSQHTMGGD